MEGAVEDQELRQLEERRRQVMEKFHQSNDPEDLFEVQEVCGKGAAGTVYKSIDRITMKEVALKIIDVLELENNNDDLQDIQTEVQVLSQCSHPNVTKYLGSYIRGSQLWIAMEFLGGGSAKDLMKPGIFDEEYTQVILREVVKGLVYIHEHGIIHRDIKATNIMLSKDGQVKLADFGVAAQFVDTMGRATICGTPTMMAPEIILFNRYDYKVDIWSTGITAIELARGNPPNHDVVAVRAMLLTKEMEPPQLTEPYLSDEYKDFVNVCLQKDPAKRPTAQELLSHPFLQTDADTSMLKHLTDKLDNWQGLTKRRKTIRNRLLDRRMSVLKKETREDFWDFDVEEKEVEEEKAAKRSPEEIEADRQLGEFLKEEGLSGSFETLLSHDIDLQTLPLLNQTDLEKMGLSIGIQKKLLAVIERLNAEEDAKKPKVSVKKKEKKKKEKDTLPRRKHKDKAEPGSELDHTESSELGTDSTEDGGVKKHRRKVSRVKDDDEDRFKSLQRKKDKEERRQRQEENPQEASSASRRSSSGPVPTSASWEEALNGVKAKLDKEEETGERGNSANIAIVISGEEDRQTPSAPESPSNANPPSGITKSTSTPSGAFDGPSSSSTPAPASTLVHSASSEPFPGSDSPARKNLAAEIAQRATSDKSSSGSLGLQRQGSVESLTDRPEKEKGSFSSPLRKSLNKIGTIFRSPKRHSQDGSQKDSKESKDSKDSKDLKEGSSKDPREGSSKE